MEYKYTRENRLLTPETYMYPPYGGKEFLAAWRRDRDEKLVEIGGVPSGKGKESYLALTTRPDAPGLAISLYPTSDCASIMPEWDNERHYETECILCKAAEFPGWILLEGESFLWRLVRIFEVRKKLPAWMSNTPLPAAEYLMTPAPYAWFSWLLGYAAISNGDLRQINCLLKVNDLLCSLEIGERADWHASMALGLACERALIHGLLIKGSCDDSC